MSNDVKKTEQESTEQEIAEQELAQLEELTKVKTSNGKDRKPYYGFYLPSNIELQEVNTALGLVEPTIVCSSKKLAIRGLLALKAEGKLTIEQVKRFLSVEDKK